MCPQDLDVSKEDLLARRARLTATLSKGPLNPLIVLDRARTYRALGFADLAVGDAYYALTLVETAIDEDFSDLKPEYEKGGAFLPWPPDGDDGKITVLMFEVMEMLIECLIELGCLRVAFGYYEQLLDFCKISDLTLSKYERLSQIIISRYQELKETKHEHRPESIRDITMVTSDLPKVGSARREVYAWNIHEPDRTSTETLKILNETLKAISPDLEARATELPLLTNTRAAVIPTSEAESTKDGRSSEVSVQIGLFAKKDLPTSATILKERSLITAVRDLDASLCDACASPLPDLSSETPPVACPDCSTVIFCSNECLELARVSYHNNKPFNPDGSASSSDSESASLISPFCGNEDGIEEIGREPSSKNPADDLYFLLITRTIAMAENQGVHPLDLPEIKYLCGEFSSSAMLPFTFTHNIIYPFRYFTTLMLSHPSITPYSQKWLEKYDFWVIQTLYAKFRGVASARQSTWDAKPEVAAVHPIWCLANHSCNPNVAWSWGDSPEITYKVRDKFVWQRARMSIDGRDEVVQKDEWNGIKKDQEILNHYCDIRLPVEERRAYAMGALGGRCKCDRCLWESGERTLLWSDVKDSWMGR